MAEQNVDQQFRKDVLKAKAKYRKRRKFIILVVMSLMLALTLVQTFLYIREKKQINSQLKEQSAQIESLEKEGKVNEIVIDKLKDPYFITDLVRQEYGLSYNGEIIFNLPLQESFLKTTIDTIMQGNAEKQEDDHGRIDDSKIPGLNKDEKDSKDSKTSSNDNKKETTDKKETAADDEENVAETTANRQTAPNNSRTTNAAANRTNSNTTN